MPFATDMEYEVVLPRKAGDNVPTLGTRLLNNAFDEAARFTVTVYVWVVDPSCAVTTMLIVVAPPSVSEIALDACPEASVFPLSLTAAPPCDTEAVTVVDVTLLATSIA